MIHDKIKEKQDWIHFSVSVDYPERFRMDAYMGLLNIPLGTLVILGESATFVNLIEGKIYKTKRGSSALEKLLRINISAKDVVSLFAEQLPLPKPWICQTANPLQPVCEQAGLKVKWAPDEKGKRLDIVSDRSEIQFVYGKKSSGRADFEVKEPRGFDIIEI